MLTIHFGSVENEIYHPPTYFINQYEDEWITDPLTVAMVKDIDKSDVIGPHLIISPVLGGITLREISGGVKTLILIAFHDDSKIFNATSCGDNCAKWLVEIGKRKDVMVTMHHIMSFRGIGDFEIKIANTGKIVHNMDELLREEYLSELQLLKRGDIL